MKDDIHKSAIMMGLKTLWSSSQYSDMIVRSGSEDFKVHRAIICPRSKFFTVACNGMFQEGKTGIINLQDDDTPTVRRMLKYLYTLDYDDNGEVASVAKYTHEKGASADLQATTLTEEKQSCAYDSPRYPELLNNIAVYAIADKYDIPELEVLAALKFDNALCCSGILKDLASFPAIVDAVFDTTPDTKVGLRDVVISYCTCWKKEIVDNEDSVAIVRDHGEIGLAMIHQMFSKESSMEARIEQAMAREKRLIWHIDRISMEAKSMKLSDSGEVQQSYIGAGLREAIQWAQDYSKKDNQYWFGHYCH